MIRVYPRPCGGTIPRCFLIIREWGLSPPVRGNRRNTIGGRSRQRSIPARAGEPTPALIRAARAWVYPRPCGGTLTSSGVNTTAVGLSPPVRGNPQAPSDNSWSTGSIPARAGEPSWFSESLP